MLTSRDHQAGTPRWAQPVFRPVTPPVTVLIDLGALYGRQAHFRRPNILVLPQMSVMVVGELEAWLVADSGWFGYCKYKVKLAHGDYLDQHHLVPSWTMQRATDWDVKQATMRGELQ